MNILTDYQGRRIRLTDERLAHILARPAMANMEGLLQELLLHPEVVRRSRSDDTVYFYYRFYEITVVGSEWL